MLTCFCVEFISETLTDDTYFAIVPPITHRLLAMQQDTNPLIRAKAQSVFRACIEQLEMYKDTTVYRDTVRQFIESALPAWADALNTNLQLDLTIMGGEDIQAALKLKFATYKVSPPRLRG